MQLYYQQQQLMGSRCGNGQPLSLFKRWKYFRQQRQGALQPICQQMLLEIIDNPTAIIGCEVEAPLRYVNWRREAITYPIRSDLNAYIPRQIALSDGNLDYFVVLMGDKYEIRTWPDSRQGNRCDEKWFSHEPVTSPLLLQDIYHSIAALHQHVVKESNTILKR